MPSAPPFASYLRIYTAKQGASGLGMDAQRSGVARHIAGAGGDGVAEFVEIESGRRKARPQLTAAVAACHTHQATLIVAKLDRFARNAAFVSAFVGIGLPAATGKSLSRPKKKTA